MKNIKKFQEEYFQLLTRYEKQINTNSLSTNEVTIILDEIKCFWLERLDIIAYELDEAVEEKTCFVLSGAIYLDVAEYEHYYFKYFGDLHFLYDPLLKLENFFRMPPESINDVHMIPLFKRAYSDALRLLASFRGSFYILPLQEIAIQDIENHKELLRSFFLRFISSAFNCKFINEEEFISKYNSFEEIEKDIDPKILPSLIFKDVGDAKLPLRQRMDKNRSIHQDATNITDGISEAEFFLISLFSKVSQVLDIMYVCIYLGVNPFIRYNITLNYLTVLMYTFIDDEKLKVMIEKTLVFYAFYKTINTSKFEETDFNEYVKKVAGRNSLNTILGELRKTNIDIFSGNLKTLEEIIQREHLSFG
jgi:hypothetical protein